LVSANPQFTGFLKKKNCKMEKLYSTEKLKNYIGDDKSQCKEMMKLFVNTIPAEFDDLALAIKQKDWSKAYEISHRIKPSMEILMIKNANEECVELHAKLHQKLDLDSLPQMFAKIHENVKLAIIQIKQDFNA